MPTEPLPLDHRELRIWRPHLDRLVERGKRYLDAVGGAYVANLGHSNPEIASSVAEQCRQYGYLSGTMFTHGPVENLADELADTLPGDLSKLYFLCSGSEAVEAALKLARQYWIERGRPDKNKIIALAPGYHGSTLLALSASAREAYKAMFRPWLVDVHRIPASYPYRCECGGKNPSCPVCSGAVLEEAITQIGANNVAAFIAEPVGGSSTGGSTPRPEYFKRVREICDRHDVLFIADEVLVGVGRTGTWWATEPYGVTPDIMTLGKGISGGYAALSAIAAPERIVDVIAQGSGSFMHAQTFSHHPVDVGDVRGRGLLAGIEFVEDKATRVPFPRAAKFAERFADAALAAGLTVWPNVGQADGTNGDLVMVAPPFIITEEEIQEIVGRLTVALEKTTARLKARV